MNEELDPQDPLDILALLLEDKASDTQRKQLIDALRRDESLRIQAAKITAIHGQLSIAMEDELSRERRVLHVISAVKDADSDQFIKGVQNKLIKNRWFNRSLMGAAVAAVLAIGLFGTFFLSNHPHDPAIQQSINVATLTRTDGVKWISPHKSTGSQLTEGQSIHIQSGLLELNLDGRGRLIIEGPAHLDFPSPDRAVLHEGRIVMRATKKGHGYQIKTSQGNIVDLGTEFGVSIEPDGSVQTHVIDGSIKVTPNNQQPTILTQNKAMAINPIGGKFIPSDHSKFYTQLPPIATTTPQFIHWGMNEGRNRIARATGELATITNHSEQESSDMIFYAFNQGASPAWQAGAKGTALHFDGKGAYTQSGYRGIGGGLARTVCFWVKVPQKFSTRQGFAMLSWGDEKKQGSVWQISANPLAADGPLGRLRIGLHGAQVIGTTDLRDSQWHHIAVVLYGGSKPNIGTHVILYIDGHMETLSRRSLAEVKTNIKDAHHGVWLGRNITYTHSDANHIHGGFFRGGIDEVYIFNTALDQKKILDLIEDAQ